MPIGIIVWLILIFIIACAGTPGFFTMILTLLGIGIVGLVIYACIVIHISDKKEEAEKRRILANSKARREQAIREWEKKWGRKHPSRQ